MPEGDTVWLAAKRLNQALAGRVVTTFELRVPKLATADLRGDTVTEVVPTGKHILTRFAGGLTLHSHLRMDGSWWINAAGKRGGGCADHQIRALIGNTEWRAIGCRVHDLSLVETTDESQLVGHLGPDLLAPDFGPATVAAAVDRLRADPQAEIGPALLEQRNLAGIGNMYKSELLFMRRVNPWTTVAQIESPAADSAGPDQTGSGGLEALVNVGRRLLFANRNHPEQSTTGRMAKGEQHWVYLRGGLPCRVCGTPISQGQQGETGVERSTYWCPRCQPRPEPDS